MGGNFKFQVQDSDLEYFFRRFEKHSGLSEKKPPLTWHQKLDIVSKIRCTVKIDFESQI